MVVSSAYLRLLIFLLATLTPACASASLGFHMMYSVFTLNKEGDKILFLNLEPACCSMSSSSCCFLTCIEISQEAGQVVWYSHLEFSRVCCDPHSQSFGIVDKTDADVFLELSCFFNDSTDVGNLTCGSSAF